MQAKPSQSIWERKISSFLASENKEKSVKGNFLPFIVQEKKKKNMAAAAAKKKNNLPSRPIHGASQRARENFFYSTQELFPLRTRGFYLVYVTRGNDDSNW